MLPEKTVMLFDLDTQTNQKYGESTRRTSVHAVADSMIFVGGCKVQHRDKIWEKARRKRRMMDAEKPPYEKRKRMVWEDMKLLMQEMGVAIEG